MDRNERLPPPRCRKPPRTGPGGGKRKYRSVPAGITAALGLLLAPPPHTGAEDSPAGRGITRQIYLDAPGNREAVTCEVVQVLDAAGEPVGYFMDVDSVVCGESECESVKVRLHFDPLGTYQRYELPSGGNLTKWGSETFSRADHEKLHQILSDPYSPLKTVTWDQITLPAQPGEPGVPVDGISRATVLSKRSVVVVGAAYTTCTLWHWSHGDAVDAIRDMTVRASDKQDWIRYLLSGKDRYVEFAIDQLLAQNLFDADAGDAVVQVLRHGSERLADPALRYLERAAKETGADCFFSCAKDELLLAVPGKRVEFLEALRDTGQEPPPGYVSGLARWLARAGSYYEIHLLLTILEREQVSSQQAIQETMALLESEDPLVVRRSYRFLKEQKLNPSQQKNLAEFERRQEGG